MKRSAEGRRQKAVSRRQKAERGVTLMELLIAMTLMSLLSTGIVMSLRMPDRNGRIDDVVLGFANPSSYFAPHPFNITRI